MQTRLDEEFRLGVTDTFYNAPCLDPARQAAVAGFTSPAQCSEGLQANPGFLGGLLRTI